MIIFITHLHKSQLLYSLTFSFVRNLSISTRSLNFKRKLFGSVFLLTLAITSNIFKASSNLPLANNHLGL